MVLVANSSHPNPADLPERALFTSGTVFTPCPLVFCWRPCRTLGLVVLELIFFQRPLPKAAAPGWPSCGRRKDAGRVAWR